MAQPQPVQRSEGAVWQRSINSLRASHLMRRWAWPGCQRGGLPCIAWRGVAWRARDCLLVLLF